MPNKYTRCTLSCERKIQFELAPSTVLVFSRRDWIFKNGLTISFSMSFESDRAMLSSKFAMSRYNGTVLLLCVPTRFGSTVRNFQLNLRSTSWLLERQRVQVQSRLNEVPRGLVICDEHFQICLPGRGCRTWIHECSGFDFTSLFPSIRICNREFYKRTCRPPRQLEILAYLTAE